MKQILSRIGWEIVEYLRRMATPFILNLMFGITMLAVMAIEIAALQAILIGGALTAQGQHAKQLSAIAIDAHQHPSLLLTYPGLGKAVRIAAAFKFLSAFDAIVGMRIVVDFVRAQFLETFRAAPDWGGTAVICTRGGSGMETDISRRIAMLMMEGIKFFTAVNAGRQRISRIRRAVVRDAVEAFVNA